MRVFELPLRTEYNDGVSPPINFDGGTADAYEYSKFKNHLSIDAGSSDLAAMTWDGGLGCWVYEFNGDNDYLEGTSLNIPLLGDATILMWMEYLGDYTEAANRYVLSLYQSADNQVNFLKHTAGKWMAIWKGGGTEERTEYNSAAAAIGMHLFGIRTKGVDLSIIIDGLVVATQSVTTKLTSAIDTVALGSAVGGGSLAECKIASMYIEDRAFNNGELEAFYEECANKLGLVRV